MTSKRLQVLDAVKALVVSALPSADVKGLNADDAKPESIGPGGTVIVRAGDPGEPEVDLSPTRYNYDHAIPLEVGAYESASKTSEQVLDEMLAAIGLKISEDPTLGGLVDWLEPSAASTDDFDAVGAVAGRWADLEIRASYATTAPLN